ncbi:Rho GTPase-activating protein [Acrasis kona]|uniref:Rho GTPase-activating protein n=1 Tax=Acrasis kona TaxID=1008807 RepID=A0AAW2ZN63_9EUKA
MSEYNDKEIKTRKKKVTLNWLGSRKRSQTSTSTIVPPAPRRKSIMQPLGQRIRQYKATEEFYENQMQSFKAISEAHDVLGEKEAEMADSLERYCFSNMTRTTTNAHALDLIDMCDQLGVNLKRLSDLKRSLNQSIDSEAVSRLDELMVASKAPAEIQLNTNQLDVETEHALTLRNVGLSRSLVAFAKNYSAYFEQGANIMKTMKVLIESIETRSTPLPIRTPSTTLIFGRPLRKVMGRYHELGEIPAQIEHCLQYVEKNFYDQPGVYRINGHASEVERIKQMLDNGEFPEFDELDINNKGHSICGTIKLYIRELPEPLLTFDKFDDFIEAAKIKDPTEQLKAFEKLLDELPELNFKLLKRIGQNIWSCD